MSENWIYAALAVMFIFSMSIDFFGHKGDKEQSLSTSIKWSIFWVAMGVLFGGFIYAVYGATVASEYYAGYAMEKCLSIDNMMVFMAIFNYFGVKSSSATHKVLTAGILGAIIFRAIFVSAGSALFHLHWSIQILFGLVVIWSAKAIIFGDDEEEEQDFDQVWYVRYLRKVFPVVPNTSDNKFFVRNLGRWAITPLLLCVVTIELSDVMFSFDSVPAVIGVAKETAVIYAAMMMAVMGLRALYFVLEALMRHLSHLDKAVALILVFVGAKLCAGPWYEVDATYSLVIVLGLLSLGVIASLVFPSEG